LIQQYKENKKNGAHPLVQAALVKDMRSAGPITQADLARKLDEHESRISELVEFADFPEPARRVLLAQKASYNVLRQISSLKKEGQERLAEALEKGLDARDISGWIKARSQESKKPAPTGSEKDPVDLEDSEETPSPAPSASPRDAPKNPFKHAKRSEGGGDSGDKTVGELIVSVLIGLAFVPAYFFCWLVKQRAYDDLCELEDRAYRRVLKYGAWNMIRWVLVALLLLVTALAMPRLRQLIHWLRHPPEARLAKGGPQTGATQTAPAAPAPPAGGTTAGGTTAPSSGASSSLSFPAGVSGETTKKVKRHDGSPTTASGMTSRVAAPSAGPVIPVPLELHASVTTPDLIRLSWRAVGLNYTYNAYSSASPQLTALRKENDRPLKSNVVDWTPETGLERYWVVVTAVDVQGRESAFSEAIEVVRHPEKSKDSTLLDQAAGAVKKVLPW
jgi:nitrogen fixation-related uncharacterized protein